MSNDDVVDGRRSTRRLLLEFIGTAALVLIGPGSVMVAARIGSFGNAGIALAFGVVVALVVHFSGAHINPAVTIAFWGSRRFPGRDVVPYLLAQCVGAIAASLVLRAALGNVGRLGATFPTVRTDVAFLIEFGYSALLALVIFAVSTRGGLARAIPSLAIGTTVMVGAYLTGPLTGGSFNPARSLGPAVVGTEWTKHWLYWLAPIAGMLLVAQFFRVKRA